MAGAATAARIPRTSRLPYRTSDARLPTTAWLYAHVLTLVWNARVRSGDLLSRGARRLYGARVQPIRGIRQLFGVNRLAKCSQSLGFGSLLGILYTVHTVQL